jgi:hypothetical protein
VRWLHGAAFIACHLIRIMSAWIPRGLYFPLVHDPLEPRLRRLCECRPSCWCETVPRRIYNAAPASARFVLLAVTFPWGRR